MVPSAKVQSVKQGRDNSATLNWNLETCGGCSHDSDGYQHDRWLYITHVGEWRLSANQTVHFNFHLGRAILRGQRAIWLACKKYYPLSTSYHSSAGEQRPVWNPGSSYQANHWLSNDRCPGREGPGARRHPATSEPLDSEPPDRTVSVQINVHIVFVYGLSQTPSQCKTNAKRFQSHAHLHASHVLRPPTYAKLQTPAEWAMEESRGDVSVWCHEPVTVERTSHTC